MLYETKLVVKLPAHINKICIWRIYSKALKEMFVYELIDFHVSPNLECFNNLNFSNSFDINVNPLEPKPLEINNMHDWALFKY